MHEPENAGRERVANESMGPRHPSWPLRDTVAVQRLHLAVANLELQLGG